MALDGIRMPDGCYADGTWELKMHVTDLHRDVSLRVTGEIHIGGVMLKLVEKLGIFPVSPARCCNDCSLLYSDLGM
uniref:Kindlin-2 N-terminal domain-containing protein n=1 Tax=Seriola lalandi dorsalis TaxID=1841481 RepID=A0A3B4YPU9_SERLL